MRPKKTPEKKKRNDKQIYVVHNMRTTMSKKTFYEIRKLQNSYNTLIPKLPFSRLVREILQSLGNGNEYRIQMAALQALQEAAEMYLTDIFTDSYLCSGHAKRVTLFPKDIKLVLTLRGTTDPGHSHHRSTV